MTNAIQINEPLASSSNSGVVISRALSVTYSDCGELVLASAGNELSLHNEGAIGAV